MCKHFHNNPLPLLNTTTPCVIYIYIENIYANSLQTLQDNLNKVSRVAMANKSNKLSLSGGYLFAKFPDSVAFIQF